MVKTLSSQQLIDIAKEFGSPVYIYDTAHITSQYQRLTEAFSQTDTRFFYACKALTNVNILQHINALGCSIDCSSVNEVKLCLMAGFQPTDILYTSNGIHFSEIEEAQSLGVHINIDSLSNLEKFGKKYGNNYPVGIRLRPNIMGGGNIKISTGHNKSKFGIPIEDLDKILLLTKQYGLQIKNLHIHTGSDISDVDIFIKGIEVLFDIIPQFKDLESIDLGGGFKVPYQPGDPETDIKLLAKKIMQAIDDHPRPRGKQLQIWFEPGKFLVSAAGYLVTQVNVIKQTADRTFVAVNSGFNHLIRPMMYDAYHTIENISNPGGVEKAYTVVGNICETDTFGSDRKIAEIKEDDYLVFYNAGAYGFEMSSNFNSRLKPAEVMIKDGKPYLIRKKEEFEDLLRQVVI